VEQVPQGLQQGFSLLTVDSSLDEQIGNRFLSRWLLTVRYFPQDDGTSSSYEELHQVAMGLYACLREVPTLEEGFSPYHGYQLRHRVEDNVLHFFASYTAMLSLDLPEEAKQLQLEVNRVQTKVGEEQ